MTQRVAEEPQIHVDRRYRYDLNRSDLPIGDPHLVVEGLALRFGGVQALDGVDVTVRRGDIHSIIGPNGAGKTSLLNCVSGIYQPQRGSITLHSSAGERSLNGLPPHQIAGHGVARSFQNIELFREMTVLENMMLGRHLHMKHRLVWSLSFFGPGRRQEARHRELVEEVIDLLHLQRVRHSAVGSLAYGIQKRVEIGRALSMQPSVLLLDEPIAGMNVDEREDMARYILDANELADMTIVLIEHDMDVVMDISDQVTVLNFGQLIATGDPAVVQSNPAVIEAYLGQEGT